MTAAVKVLLLTSDGELAQTFRGALTGQASAGAARIRQEFVQRWKVARGGREDEEPPKWALSLAKSIDSATDWIEQVAQREQQSFIIVIDGDTDQHESVLLFMLTVQAVSEHGHLMIIARGGGASLRQAIDELGDANRCTFLRKPASPEEMARSMMFIAWRGVMTMSLRQAEQKGFSGVGAADLASAMLIEGEAEQRRMAVQDTLTKLGNRRLFDATLSEICALPSSHRTHVLMLIDLDRFKAVNDTLGHAAGDALLQQVADRLRASVGPNDVVFRLGGDEFAMIKADATGAQELAEKVITELSRPFEVLGHPARIGASIGWAAPEGAHVKADVWTSRADLALYAAKGAGRGRAIRYSQDQDRRRQERESLESRVRAHMAAGVAPLLFSPVADAASGAVIGLEAVLDFGADGLADLTEARLDSLISDPILATDLAFWIAGSAIHASVLSPHLQISLNITPRALQNDSLVDRLAAVAADMGVDRGRIMVEAPSASVFANLDVAGQRLKALADAGFGVILDEFGVGPFSVDGLLRIPVDQVKIAASMTKEAMGSASALRIISGLCSIVSGAGLRVCASGVDNEQMAAKLRAMGCARLQGRFVGPLKGIEAWGDDGANAPARTARLA
jgi:diguanylate cyclase (GGDEF)-like protein